MNTPTVFEELIRKFAELSNETATQDLTNENGSFIGGRDTFFRFGGGLTNNGEIGLSVGVHDILGSIDNTINGRVMVAGQSTATFYGDMTNDGDIFTGQGSQSVFLGDVTGSGRC